MTKQVCIHDLHFVRSTSSACNANDCQTQKQPTPTTSHGTWTSLLITRFARRSLTSLAAMRGRRVVASPGLSSTTTSLGAGGVRGPFAVHRYTIQANRHDHCFSVRPVLKQYQADCSDGRSTKQTNIDGFDLTCAATSASLIRRTTHTRMPITNQST